MPGAIAEVSKWRKNKKRKKLEELLKKLEKRDLNKNELRNNFVTYSQLISKLGREAYAALGRRKNTINYEFGIYDKSKDAFVGDFTIDKITLRLRGSPRDLNTSLHELGHFDKLYTVEKEGLMSYAIKNPSRYPSLFKFGVDKKLKWLDEAYAMYFNYKGLKFLLNKYSNDPLIYNFVKKAAKEFIEDIKTYLFYPKKLPRRVRKLYHNAAKIFLMWYKEKRDLKDLEIDWTK